LLDHPHYTRPAEFRGHEVPEVLMSGNHAAIERWRRQERIRRTLARRPDLLATATLNDDERRELRLLELKNGKESDSASTPDGSARSSWTDKE